MEDKSIFKNFKQNFHKLSGVQILLFGYMVFILIGSCLLALPISSKDGNWTAYINALFTATSATCVTGLVVYDTFSHWSIFGQIVILCLIQIGGIGFMTVITLIAMFFRRKIGLYERKLLMQSTTSMRMNGIVTLIRKILIGTLIFESIGALLLATRFCPIMGLGEGIYYAIFHSVSAFCNAGFDLMGSYQQFSSFTTFYDDFVINITLMMLIVIGGLGFYVWSDVWDNKFKFKKFSLHTKIVLSSTILLILIPTVLFIIFEANNAYKGESQGKIILLSLFQAITPRTAGFNTIDLTQLSNSSLIVSTLLMFIGGNSGSTAGGIKVTTFVVLVLSAISSAKNKSEIEIFKKRLSPKIIQTSGSIALVYVLFILVGTATMCAMQPSLALSSVIFEVVSAIGTVGLSLGITTQLTMASKFIIMLLMFAGRLGALSFALAFIENNDANILKRPIGNIMIG